MGTNFQYSKTLTCEGTILLILGLIPYVGWVLGIIGIILLLRGLKELAGYYQDSKIYDESYTGVKYYIVALIAAGVATAGLVLGIGSLIVVKGLPGFGVVGGALGVGVGVASIVIAFVFFFLASMHLRKTLNTLAQKSGETSFATAGALLWWGSILTIIVIGLLLIFIAWIFATIGFFTMKPQQLTGSQPYSYAPPPSVSGTVQQLSTMERFCSKCGAPVALDATYCPPCGKPLTA